MRRHFEYGSASNHYITALYHAATARGVDSARLLELTGLAESVVDKPEQRVPAEKLALFQKLIWDDLGDESMGLSGYRLKSGSYYMMGQLTVQKSSLGQALALGARFYNLLTDDDFITLHKDKEVVRLIIRPTEMHLDPDHLFAEICLLAWHRYASWLISDILPLTETRFPYPPPNHIGEYHYLFPGVHRFNHTELALVFPVHYLERPVKQNAASLKAFMSRCPLELFRQYKADYSLATELKLILSKAMSNGTGTIEHCADKLHMTTRTLMRKLKDEGTSFQQLKDVVRRDKAIFFLGQQGLRINEVAEKVGYSDPAVFTRAFRNWTGQSPRDFRQQLLTDSEA
ncbi:AraC family transcriptional regulator [Alteromonas sp. 1_MG-2023]|uniref:AraC family transcriptional regulator n=1 Tax=Alteromonas sp. 1_MG-2023 TaxID=3062669 RepID=UPI0026E2C82E|nr:AraC family transcriptional regulator [Alteromonas sp. 1_MG-2023]MDO6474550.1 AraC family transcriptional regulator [Alteromonas sp. 1_MG-2023]